MDFGNSLIEAGTSSVLNELLSPLRDDNGMAMPSRYEVLFLPPSGCGLGYAKRSTRCIRCERGSYKNVTGMDNVGCSLCPNKRTSFAGAKSIDSCFKRKFWLRPSVRSVIVRITFLHFPFAILRLLKRYSQSLSIGNRNVYGVQ